MKNLSLKRIVIALLGIFIVCVGVAFNNKTLLGNDPIGIVYDGIRNAIGMSQNQLGLLCQESGHKSANKFDFQFKLLNLIL